MDPTSPITATVFGPVVRRIRPSRQSQQFIAEGYSCKVDLELEKFFDRVEHHRLMAKFAERVSDKRVLKLIRAFALAANTAGSAHGPWRLAHSRALAALPNAYFDSLGLPRLVVQEGLNLPNRRMRTRMSGGVAGARG